MKKLILLFLACAAATVAQQTVTLCWSSGSRQTCQTFQPSTVTILTLDMRISSAQPVPVLVVQPLPFYQVSALQSYVSGQTYNIQQSDSSVVTHTRFTSIQDLLMQNIVRAIGIPALQMYPQTGNTNTTPAQVLADLSTSQRIIPILPEQ